MIVLRERRLPLPRHDVDGHDLLGKTAVGPRARRELLAAQRVFILRLARDAVFHRAVLRGDRHRAAAVRIEQRFPQRVFELRVIHAQAGAHAADDVRRLRHALHAAGERDARLAQLNQLRAADRRLQSGSTQAVDGERRHFDRHAGLQADMTRAVERVAAGLHHVAEDDVIDPGGIDVGALHRGAGGDHAEVDRGEILQRADELAHRRARAAEDEDVARSIARLPMRMRNQSPIWIRPRFLIGIVCSCDECGDRVACFARAQRAAGVGGHLT